jgi:NADH-quinone oxidoreductase subunit A
MGRAAGCCWTSQTRATARIRADEAPIIALPRAGGGWQVSAATGTLLAMTTSLAYESFNQYAAVGILVVMAIIFGVFNIIVSTLLGPSKLGEDKGRPYESGMNPFTSARRRFNVRFFIVAMTFLLFDVEIVFLYPWAVTFPSLAGPGGEALEPLFLGRMLFFILTSIVAFMYAWRKGVFRYD